MDDRQQKTSCKRKTVDGIDIVENSGISKTKIAFEIFSLLLGDLLSVFERIFPSKVDEHKIGANKRQLTELIKLVPLLGEADGGVFRIAIVQDQVLLQKCA